jgi:hypothetical protein
MEELLERYNETFGDAFPTFELMRTMTDREVMEIIKRCLSEGRDAYELGYVTDDMDVKY